MPIPNSYGNPVSWDAKGTGWGRFPPSVWPHVSWCWSWEKDGRAAEVVLAFRLYIGSFPCAHLPVLVRTAQLGRVYFCVLSLGLCFVHLCFLICLCGPILVCFPGQLSHLPYSFSTSVTNLNEPPRVLAAFTIEWVNISIRYGSF